MSTLGKKWGFLSWERGICQTCGSSLRQCCKQGNRDTLRWYNVAKRLYVLGLLGGKCEICGTDDPLYLEIAHKIPIRRNEWGKAEAAANTAFRLRDTVASHFKCLCANHHRAETYLRNEWRSTKFEKRVVIHREEASTLLNS